MRFWRMKRNIPRQHVCDIWHPAHGKSRVVTLKPKLILGMGAFIAVGMLAFGLLVAPGGFLRAGGLANSVWPKHGNNERNTARQDAFFVQTGGFTQSWAANLGPADLIFLGNPVIGSDGTIYIGGYDLFAPVYALNPNGQLKWQVALGDGSEAGIDATIALDAGGNLLVPTPYGFFKLRPGDGSIVWSLSTLLSDGSSPTVSTNGVIYTYGTGGGMPGAAFFALNADGTIAWSISLTAPSRGVPSIASDGTIYFSTQDGYLWALNPDGTTKWTYSLGQPAFISTMVGQDGTVYVATTLRLYAVNPDGTLKWQHDATGSYIGNGLAEGTNGTVYFGTYGPPHALYAVNPDGTLKWQYELASGVDGGVSIDGNGIIYVPANESVYAIGDGTGSGNKLWQVDRSGGFSFYGTPVISADSRLLIISSADSNTVTALIPEGLKSIIPIAFLSKPPTVTIESPKSGDAVGEGFALSYTAKDPEGTGSDFGLGDYPIDIDYSLDEGIVGTWKTFVVSGKNEGSIKMDAKTFGDGAAAYFRIVVRDRTGLIDEDVIGPVYVDITPPAFLVKAPVSPKPGFINISITSTKPLRGAPDVYVDQAGRGRVLAVTRGEGVSYTAQYEVVQGFDGIATVYVTGIDRAGNVGTTILSGGRFSVFVTPPPRPVVFIPQDGNVLAEPFVAISGTLVPTAKVVIVVNGVDRYVATPASDSTFSVYSVKLSTANKGKNIISITAEDAVGISEPVERTLIVNSPPNVAITVPRPGRTLADAARITWNAQDENQHKLRFAFAYSTDNERTWITTATGIAGISYSWDTTLAPDGPGVKIRVTASDGLSESHAVVGSLTLKNYLPAFTVESPASPELQRGEPVSQFINTHTLALKGHGTSEISTIAALAYSFDSVSWTALPAQDGAYDSASEAFALTVPREIPDGQFTMFLRAQDARKKFGYKELTYAIDTVPPRVPALRIDRDSASAELGRGEPAIYKDTDDIDAATAGLQVQLLGTSEPLSAVRVVTGAIEVGGDTVDAAGNIVLMVTIPQHGANAFTVYAQDRAGNRSATEQAFTLIANNPSTLELMWPGATDNIGAQSTIRWRTKDADSDTVGDFRIEIRKAIAGRTVAQSAWQRVADGLKTMSYTWTDAAKLSSGVYEMRISGFDGYERSEVIAQVRVDTVPPALFPRSLIPARTNNPSVKGEGVAYDDFSGVGVVEFSLGEEAFTKATLVSGYRTPTSTYRFVFPSALDDGTYVLKLRATDEAENISEVTSVRFTIDTTPPRIGSWRMMLGPLQLFPNMEGVLEVFAGTSYEYSLAVSQDAQRTVFFVGDTPFNLHEASGQIFKSSITLEKPGTHMMRVEVADDLGNKKPVEVGGIRVISPAQIVRARTQEPVAGAKVSAYFYDKDSNAWLLWDGEAYGQENPVESDAAGTFRYFLPEGTYELRVRASEYKRAKTSPFTLQKPTLVTLTIPLEKSGFWERVLQMFGEK